MAKKKADASTALELVEIVRNRPVTTSLKVAEIFEKRHDLVIRNIRTLIGEVGGVLKNAETPSRPYFHETTYVHPQNGQRYPMYEMDFNAFTLVAMGFTGKRALEFKLQYIDAFNKMAEILHNWKNPEWVAVRGEVKVMFRKLTDAIKAVIIPLARAKGSTTPDDRFYMSWSKMLCEVGCYKPNTREKLSLGHNYILHQLENLAVMNIYGLAEMKILDYKAIYRTVKTRLNNFARIAMINERYGDARLITA